MKLRWKLAIGAAVGFFMLGTVVFFYSRQSQTELEKYKAELRAKGEILDLDALAASGPATSNSLVVFIKAAEPLRNDRSGTKSIEWMKNISPGKVRLLSAEPFIPLDDRKRPHLPWADLAKDLQQHATNLQVIRDFLTNAPSRLEGSYRNVGSFPTNPFVLKRETARYFAASTLNHVRQQNADEVVRELEAMCALANMHEHDPTLVNGMIRVALAGFATEPTWHALYGITNWTDLQLSQLQGNFEALDLLKMLEAGISGERNFGLKMFEAALEQKSDFLTPSFSRIWRSTVGMKDAAFYLGIMQEYIETVRRLRKTEDFTELRQYLARTSGKLQKTSGTWQRYIYLFSSIAIPNFVKAPETAVRNEIMRRLTVVAIALKRHETRHGQLPASLNELVPEFLPTVPIDCMDGKPLRYQLKKDGTFLLYSVGTNGKDDGGDASLEKTGEPLEMWTGLDAVWPKPALP